MSSIDLRSKTRSVLGQKRYAQLRQLHRRADQRRRTLKEILARPSDVVFYCEQPSHWQNVELVVRCLLSMRPDLKIRLIATYDRTDYPDAVYAGDLKADFKFPHSCLAAVRTRLLYTPLSGLTRDMMPKNAQLVHALHSLTSLDGAYEETVFDNYDYILCAGPHHIADFRRWRVGNIRLEGKVLIPAGYPKLDLTLRDSRAFPRPTGDHLTVIYAPTFVYSVNKDLASLRLHGEVIVDSLISAGHNVIFRPHPVSFTYDGDVIDRIASKYSGSDRFFLDRSKNYMAVFAKADLMVTDVSGTGFTFSLTFLRPTIFFSPNAAGEAGLKGIQYEDRQEIGGVVRTAREMIDFIDGIEDTSFADGIRSYRARTLYNVGSSSAYITEALAAILVGQAGNNWTRI